MTEEITVEVDPSELSDEVVEGLVEDGVLDEEMAEEYGDNVWFEEVDTGEPSKTGSVGYIRERFRNGKELASWFRWLFSDYKTVLADIESVERTDNDRVKLHIHHGRIGTKTVRLYPDSNKMANILEWKGVDNPLELEDSRIPLLRDSLDERRNYVLIPHNVSASGRLRFLLYNGVEEVREKTKISRTYEDPEGLLMWLGIGTLVGLIPILPATGFWSEGSTLLAGLLALPLVLTCTGVGLLALYGLFRVFLFVLSGIFDSEYIEMRCR